MNRTLAFTLTVAILVALGGGVLIGKRLSPATAQPETSAPAPRKPLYYRNPMGLPDTSPVPKKDEMGMDYIPVYAEDEASGAPGTVALSPEKIQTLGVRTESVRRGEFSRQIQASGTVSVDETRQHVVAPRFDGWVDTLQANQTGMAVKRGQPLATVYSPQLLAAQEDYRVADAALRQLKKGDPASQAAMKRLRDAAKRRLLNWQISEDQLEHLAHLPPGNLTLTAPINGVIVEKPVVQGSRFVAGDTLLRLADLSTVWVTVAIPTAQSDSVQLGQPARFTTPALPGKQFDGSVQFIQPMLDTATRTLSVRITLPNTDGNLRPGLFGNVTLADDAETQALTIPRSALIDTGERQIVLVEIANGRFAPRSVVVGQRGGDRIAIESGLREGERVVVEGNFLIDAESNLRAALQDMLPAQEAPHAEHDMAGHTMQAPASAPAPASDPHAGHTLPQSSKPDPHAGHTMQQTSKADPHAGHDMSGHDMSTMEH